MKPEHFVEPCANPVTLQTFISPTDNPGPGASAAAAASSMTETQIDTGPWPGDRHWPMGPGALPGASAYPNLSLRVWHQPAASDSDSESESLHLEKRHEGLSRDIPGYPDLVYIPG